MRLDQKNVIYGIFQGLPGGAVVKNPAADQGDTGDEGSIPGSGRSPGVGNGKPLQYSCLGNPMNREVWAGQGPWGRRESNTPERFSIHMHAHAPSIDIKMVSTLCGFKAWCTDPEIQLRF